MLKIKGFLAQTTKPTKMLPAMEQELFVSLLFP